MTLTHDDILLAAMPGVGFASPPGLDVSSLTELPHKWWRHNGKDWAIFVVVGRRVGETMIKSVHQARRIGVSPVVIVRNDTELAAVANRYGELKCHVVCPIAGQGVLLPPFDRPATTARKRRRSTRIPQALLREIAKTPSLRGPMKRNIKRLQEAYSRFTSVDKRDEEEQAALTEFRAYALKQMGFCAGLSDTLAMVRKLENAGWGADRDHYFHSYQNFFFGLYVVLRLLDHFELYRAAAKVDWSVDPLHVWLLVSLWHDVGYGVSHHDSVSADAFGVELGEEHAEATIAEYLAHPTIQEAMLHISALISRLLNPAAAGTAWLPPTKCPRKNSPADRIRSALIESVKDDGHGAPSSLRLYADLIPAANRMAAEKRTTLSQIVLLAGASLPFHDDNFRLQMRAKYGAFQVSTEVMPFAALLAFVDSIQDDRRDLEGVKEEVRFLQRMLVQTPATVTARVDKAALPCDSLLWKAVEARDVLACLSQSTAGLFFKYPDWMAG